MKRTGIFALGLALAGFWTGVAIAQTTDPVVASVKVTPDSAKVKVGSQLEFKATAADSSGKKVEAAVVWSVSDTLIGTVSAQGMFKAKKIGSASVIAAVGAIADTAFVTVIADSTVQPSGPSAAFYRNIDGKITKFGDPVVNGGTITLGGLPSPFNFLNGTKLTFPEGSLTESVTITFSAPKFSKVEKDSVIFEGKLLTGVTFEVAVNGTVKSPYHFGKPIGVTMPYKKGLLTKLGLKAEDIKMFFANDLGAIQNDTGVATTGSDTENGTVTANVAHFSTLVLAPQSMAPVAVEEQAPAAFALSQNVPNPFNPATSISFAVPTTGMVKLVVCNVLGQEVRTLVNGYLPAGSHSVVWNGRDNAGRAVTSGVYFYRVEAGPLSAAKKLMLLK